MFACSNSTWSSDYRAVTANRRVWQHMSENKIHKNNEIRNNDGENRFLICIQIDIPDAIERLSVFGSDQVTNPSMIRNNKQLYA